MVEQAAGNFGEATTLRNLARSCNDQRMSAMSRPAPRMKGPTTLSYGIERRVIESNTTISAVA